MSRRPLIVGAFALAALPLLAGCELRADVELTVDGDGGGSLAVALEVDEALEREARAAGFDMVEAIERATSDLEGWETETAERGVRLSADFDDPGELRQVSGAFAGGLAGPELDPLETFEVMLTDQRVIVEGGAALEPADQLAALGLDHAEAVSLLDEGVSYEVAVDMPGDVLEHNADREDGERLAWDVPAGERVEIRAEAERPEGPPLGLLGAAAAGVALLGGALLAAARRRRRRWRL